MTFPTPDHLIRRIRFPDHIKKGKVRKEAFKPDPSDAANGLSVTCCADKIASDSDLDEYQAVLCDHPQVVLGICFVTLEQVKALSLQARPDPIEDEPYGDLHRLIRNEDERSKCPTWPDQCSSLALRATEVGRFRPATTKDTDS